MISTPVSSSPVEGEQTAHTPGPWQWFGNASSNSVYLATTHSGRRYIMDFVRWGMRGAQPRFQPKARGGMIDAKDLLQFEVGDRSIVGIEDARKDGSVYRYDVLGIDSADARLIAAAPDLLEACRAMYEHLSMNPTGVIGWNALLNQAEAALSRAEGRAARKDGA